MPSNIASEKDLAQTVHAYLDLCVQKGWLVYLDRPSPRPGSSREGHFHVKGGVDIIVWTAQPLYGGPYTPVVSRVMVFELKAKRGKLTPDQKEFAKLAVAQGAWHRIVKTLEQVHDGLRDIGVPVNELGELQL